MTTNANMTVAELHERMPVIVKEQDWPVCWPVWLGQVEGIPAELLQQQSLNSLFEICRLPSSTMPVLKSTTSQQAGLFWDCDLPHRNWAGR